MSFRKWLAKLLMRMLEMFSESQRKLSVMYFSSTFRLIYPNGDKYIDHDEVVVVLSQSFLLLREVITQGDHVELIKQLEVRVELLAVLDVRLQIFVGRPIKLLRLERELSDDSDGKRRDPLRL